MKSTTEISVVVTDLDDTLFDWVGLWHRCFSAMLGQVLKISGLDRDRVLDDFQSVHRRYGTCEYAFALQELTSLLDREGSPEAITEKYASAIDAYRKARRAHLRLYPGVLGGLIGLRGRGCLVVGYTESLAFYSNYRIRRLGLDGVLDYLFSPEDHDIPQHLSEAATRYYNPSAYQFRHTVHRHTAKGELKPNPKVLLDILSAVGATPTEALYVGDKLHKDVSMAKKAGVMDVHACYGESHRRDEYDLLKRVTHWTPEMVRVEQEQTTEVVNPTYSIEKFSDVLGLATFLQFEKPLVRN